MASHPILPSSDLEGETENCILLDDLLTKIIQNIPLAEWFKLELVSKQFLRCVQNAYHGLRKLDLKSAFLPDFGIYVKKPNENIFRKLLTKLIHRCPLLQAISGFNHLLTEISRDQLDMLCELTELNNVSFKCVIVDIDDLSRFSKKFPKMKSLELLSYNIKTCDDGPKYDSVYAFFIRKPEIKPADYYNFLGNFTGLMELTFISYTTCDKQYLYLGSFLSMINAENLRVLNFTESQFKATCMCDLLNRAVNLETLSLYDRATPPRRRVLGLELEVLHCLPNLTKLCKFDLEIIEWVEGHMMAGGYKIEYTADDLMDVFMRCRSLRNIRLQSYQVEIITDHFLHRLIDECPLLEALNFSTKYCHCEEMLSNVVYLHHLKHLVIDNSYNYGNVLNELCSKLHNLDNLSHLTIFGNIEEDALMSLNKFQNLTSFICNGIVTERVARNWIKDGFLKLTYLAARFVNDGAKVLFGKAPHLKEIIVCGEINDETLLVIRENYKYLQLLDLEFCSSITNEGLLKLFLSSCSLERLIIRSTYHKDLNSNVLFQQFKQFIYFYNSSDEFNYKLKRPFQGQLAKSDCQYF